MEILLAVITGWLITLTGVIVGGYIGYRAKNGGYEPFMRLKKSETSAFNLPDEHGEMFDEPGDVKLPDVAERMNERFRQQAGEDLGVKNVA